MLIGTYYTDLLELLQARDVSVTIFTREFGLSHGLSEGDGQELRRTRLALQQSSVVNTTASSAAQENDEQDNTTDDDQTGRNEQQVQEWICLVVRALVLLHQIVSKANSTTSL